MGTALSYLLPLAGTSRANADGPPLGHTGGFGEPTCQDCHVGNALNAPGGLLGVEGIPATYLPGERYRITVVLQHEDMGAAGFQAALRFSGGDRDGTQAGRLEPYDTRVVIRTDHSTGVEYAQHSPPGSMVEPGTLAVWSFFWTAPRAESVVVLHAAANSGNGDNSPLEDLIYAIQETTRATATPSTIAVMYSPQGPRRERSSISR